MLKELEPSRKKQPQSGETGSTECIGSYQGISDLEFEEVKE
jgi:hypothetical protein